MPQTKVIPTSDVKLGDRITEMDTPEGPFYTVTRETAKSFWLDADQVVRFAKSPRAGVRVAV